MKKRILVRIILLAIITISYTVWRLVENNTSLVLYGNVDIRTVNSSFRVNGRLAQLYFQEGDKVHEGERLASLDDSSYQIALSQANANLMVQQAQLNMVTAGYRTEEVSQAAAQVSQYQAAYDYAVTNYARMQKLIATAAISKDQFDNSLTLRNQAEANLQAAKDKLEQLTNGYRKEEIQSAQAAVAVAEAQLQQAKLNLSDTVLYAPNNGTILTRAIEAGTLLSAGSTVYAISLDRPVWVRAYIDEVNLSKAIPGKTAYIYTDAKPNEAYTGKIGFVSPTAEFTPKSVETSVLRTALVYRLRIQIDAEGTGKADEMLRQGMPVTIKFLD